jgi:CDP-paratose 2-epimerase
LNTEKIVITGGAGFIGANLAHRLLSEGHRITIFDNLSRSGAIQNVEWLRSHFGDDKLCLVVGDLLDFQALSNACEGANRIYHLAGQVAVTVSVRNPRLDFEGNALGTFNVLEAARLVGDDPILLYASTNKVYGAMPGVQVAEDRTRYHYCDFAQGIPESYPLDFHSPYGCSKGTGDQYARDYARIYKLRTVVVRQSCIYGYRQFGIEDQGWLAWFMIAALKRRPITIYGNGKQVRDLLFIDDSLDAYAAVVANIDRAAGEIYNIGGGPQNTVSIWAEFGPLLEELLGEPIPVTYEAWRPGDQPVYVSNISKAKCELGWEPRVDVQQGIRCLYTWIESNRALFAHL